MDHLLNVLYLYNFLTTSDNSMVIRLGFSTNFFLLLHLCISGEGKMLKSRWTIIIPKGFGIVIRCSSAFEHSSFFFSISGEEEKKFVEKPSLMTIELSLVVKKVAYFIQNYSFRAESIIKISFDIVRTFFVKSQHS